MFDINDSLKQVFQVPLPTTRLRRLRAHHQLRALIQEHRLSVQDMVLPVFVTTGTNIKKPIPALSGHYQWSVDRLDEIIESLIDLKIPAILLFGILTPAEKNATGSIACQPNGLIQRAIQEIKNFSSDIMVMADLCFCEYTSHGHCGPLYEHRPGEWDVHNDHTLSLLAEQAVSLASAGVDVIAPSGMMDGVVAAIRYALDTRGFHAIPIMSYAVKYASSFYAPFRSVVDVAVTQGDRMGYQMDLGHGAQAIREAELDVAEGVDMLMVKPAHTYLDIIYRIKQRFPAIPLGAYHVSGEFIMIKTAAASGYLDEQAVMLESLLAMKRAGADFIITYFAASFAALTRE